LSTWRTLVVSVDVFIRCASWLDRLRITVFAVQAHEVHRVPSIRHALITISILISALLAVVTAILARVSLRFVVLTLVASWLDEFPVAVLGRSAWLEGVGSVVGVSVTLSANTGLLLTHSAIITAVHTRLLLNAVESAVIALGAWGLGELALLWVAWVNLVGTLGRVRQAPLAMASLVSAGDAALSAWVARVVITVVVLALGAVGLGLWYVVLGVLALLSVTQVDGVVSFIGVGDALLTHTRLISAVCTVVRALLASVACLVVVLVVVALGHGVGVPLVDTGSLVVTQDVMSILVGRETLLALSCVVITFEAVLVAELAL